MAVNSPLHRNRGDNLPCGIVLSGSIPEFGNDIGFSVFYPGIEIYDMFQYAVQNFHSVCFLLVICLNETGLGADE